MQVIIDGVTYVPETTIEHADQPAVDKAIRSIVTCIHLYGPFGRGPGGCLLDALEALAPNLAALYRETGEIQSVCDALPGLCE